MRISRNDSAHHGSEATSVRSSLSSEATSIWIEYTIHKVKSNRDSSSFTDLSSSSMTAPVFVLPKENTFYWKIYLLWKRITWRLVDADCDPSIAFRCYGEELPKCGFKGRQFKQDCSRIYVNQCQRDSKMDHKVIILLVCHMEATRQH